MWKKQSKVKSETAFTSSSQEESSLEEKPI